MSTPTLTVARYSALFSGVVYGWYHRRTLQAEHEIHKAEHAAHGREKLVAEAKEAWKAKQLAKVAPKDEIITDPEHPQFDLEKLIAKFEKAS